MNASRSNYEDSFRYLQKHGHIRADKQPLLPDRPPRYDDKVLVGVRFFRTLVNNEVALDNLTLPRTYFGRSKIDKASFRNSELSESSLCWNDFLGADFTDAVLAKADMRSSLFSDVSFNRADLRGADLRRSTFNRCIFDGAMLDGAVLTSDQSAMLSLTSAQREAIDWRNDPGSEPGGG
jgi:BTB/POZ domain-containing protein KCTD9